MRRWLLMSWLLASCTDFDSLDSVRDASYDATAPVEDSSATPPRDLAEPDDLSTNPDIGPNCSDGEKGPGETDVDCGGACPPCDVGKACITADDCLTSECESNTCELASGPPSWVVVGTAPTNATTAPIARNDGAMGQGPDGNLYIFGGHDSTGASLQSVDEFDLTTWSVSSGLAHHRDAPCVAQSATALYALYGLYSSTVITQSIDAMTSPPDWATLTSPVESIVACGAAVGGDGNIYVFGGNDNNGAVLDALISFAPGDATATSLMAMITPRNYFGSSIGSDGRIYAVGGMTTPTGLAASKLVEAYDLTTQAWTSVAPLTDARAYAPAVLGPDGRIYIPGGAAPSSGRVWATVEAYRARTSTTADAWVATASMHQPRWQHAAAMGSDGRIYVVAGSGISSMLRTVEAYGPIFAAMTSTASAGSQVSVSGTNFAASATINVTMGSPTGTPIGSGTSDSTGTLASLTVTIPTGAALGSTLLYATDTKSRYPVSTPFTVTQ